MSFTLEQSQEAFDSSLELYTQSIHYSANLLIKLKDNKILKNNFNYPINLHQNEDNFDIYLKSIASDDNTTSLINILQDKSFLRNIGVKTQEMLSSYIELYDIETRGIDNYKVRYFMGISILNEIEVLYCSSVMEKQINIVVVRLMLLIVMQLTLQVDYKDAIANDMFKKIALTLMFVGKNNNYHNNSPLNYYFGKHGLYTLFKTVSKI